MLAVDVAPNLYEGDIQLTDHDQVDLTDDGDVDAPLGASDMVKRNAQRVRQYLWKTKRIPYEIDSKLSKLYWS